MQQSSIPCPDMLAIDDVPDVSPPINTPGSVDILASVPGLVFTMATLDMSITDQSRVQARPSTLEICRVGAG